MREGKRILLRGLCVALCSEKAHNLCITFGHSVIGRRRDVWIDLFLVAVS
jgi:hypothetical protein